MPHQLQGKAYGYVELTLYPQYPQAQQQTLLFFDEFGPTNGVYFRESLKSTEIAKKLINLGLSDAQISSTTDLSIEEIHKLKKT